MKMIFILLLIGSIYGLWYLSDVNDAIPSTEFAEPARPDYFFKAVTTRAYNQQGQRVWQMVSDNITYQNTQQLKINKPRMTVWDTAWGDVFLTSNEATMHMHQQRIDLLGNVELQWRDGQHNQLLAQTLLFDLEKNSGRSDSEILLTTSKQSIKSNHIHIDFALGTYQLGKTTATYDVD